MTIPVLKEVNIEPYTNYDALNSAASFLDTMQFSKVKTRYTKGTDWTALSLRGYSDDCLNILKPGVLKSGVDESAELQDTFLRKENALKPVNEILKKIPADFERVRFMSLKAGTIIGKHTDKIDKDIGLEIGKIIRLHIPIRTHSKVEFSVWDKRDKITFLMVEGKYYYTDVTKPHSVENNSKIDRIHLVVDCYCNAILKGLVLGDTR